MEEVIIVGAGLSGLSAACYLKKGGVDAILLEARERCGGRIFTSYGEENDAPAEMGATWFSDKHTYLTALLAELELPFFGQFYEGTGVFERGFSQPPQLFDTAAYTQPSNRVAGGTSALVDALARFIGKERVIFNCQVSEITDQADHLRITGSTGRQYQGRQVIFTIPPFLAFSQEIQFSPPLPDRLVQVMQTTHTWMSDSIKFALHYPAPFWRDKGYSGTVFSQSGIAQEVYDHSNRENTRFALKGFLSPLAYDLSGAEREKRVVDQLSGLIGKQAQAYLSYTEMLWKDEVYTHAPYDSPVFPHQNNGNSLFKQPLMNGKLHLAGTETSPVFGGYMDGAVYSGMAAARNVLSGRSRLH